MTSSFRTLRLRKHADYGLVYGASRKHQSASLSFFYRERSASVTPDKTDTTPRFGITVPKVLGNAPLRNRLKRRIRVVARVALPLLPHGVDVVLHPRPVTATMALPLLQKEIETVFATVASRVATGAVNTPLPRQPRREKPKKKTSAAKPVSA